MRFSRTNMRLAAARCRSLSRKIGVQTAEFSITAFCWRNAGLKKSRTYTGSGRRTRRGFLCGREAGRLVRHEARRRAMARVADHLSVDDLEARLRSAQDPTATR